MKYNEKSLFTKDPIEIIEESFDDIHNMTIKELKNEYEKNLKKIQELKDEISDNREGYPKFSIEEQITELKNYNEKILKQLEELKTHKIDTTAYESVLETLEGFYKSFLNRCLITESEYTEIVGKWKKLVHEDKKDSERLEVRRTHKGKKRQMRTFKKRLKDYM